MYLCFRLKNGWINSWMQKYKISEIPLPEDSHTDWQEEGRRGRDSHLAAAAPGSPVAHRSSARWWGPGGSSSDSPCTAPPAGAEWSSVRRRPAEPPRRRRRRAAQQDAPPSELWPGGREGERGGEKDLVTWRHVIKNSDQPKSWTEKKFASGATPVSQR